MDSALLITILILICVSILFVLANRAQRQEKQKSKSRMLNSLEALKAGAQSEDLSRRRDTVIKLDNILSKALQYRLNNNALCGDNLRNIKKRFKKNEYEELWEVHKLRNRIVHDDMDVTESEAHKAYRVYNMAIHRILK